VQILTEKNDTKIEAKNLHSSTYIGGEKYILMYELLTRWPEMERAG
jgi:hypothetical protein